MENTWGMRNENAAALDSESRIGCLDPESRIRCRMQEMVARIRVIWRPERRSPLWAVDFWNLMVRYRPRGGNPQGPRTLFRPWNSPSPGHKFLRKSWSRFSFSARIRGFALHPPVGLMVRFRVLRRSMCFCMLFFVYKEVLGGVRWGSGRAPSERLEHSPGIRIASVGRWAWWVVLPGSFLKRRNLEIFPLLSVTGVNSFSEVGILGAFKCLPGGGGEFWMSKMSRLKCWEGA